MTSHREGRIEQIFAAAVELPAEERRDYLAAQADSAETKAEVLALIEAHESRGHLDSIGEWLHDAETTKRSIPIESVQPRLRSALAGRYRINGEISRGGMAIVLHGEDLDHHRSVAVKVLRPNIAIRVGPARFLREIAIASRLTHPLIVPLLDSGEADALVYYVMPYMEGESLRDRLRRQTRLSLSDTLAIARDVAEVLEYAHGHGVMHRDIKPGNILLVGGRALVTDFGIARGIGAEGMEALTRTGVLVGTPAYMSPEQVEPRSSLDERSDIYSLACVTCEMLTGEPPFTGETIGEVLHKHLTAPVPRMRKRVRKIPRKVDAAVRKALAKAPHDRFASARQFADALVAR